MKYNDNGEYKDIYIKTFDTLPVGTEVDYDGNTVPDGWTEVTNIQPEIYSSNETICGTWIDGKPLYRKVFYRTSNLSSPLDIAHGISNLGYIKVDGWLSTTTTNTPPFYSSGTDFFRVFRNEGYLCARYGTGITASSITFIVEYTKTTD